jgi:hypothetical protein
MKKVAKKIILTGTIFTSLFSLANADTIDFSDVPVDNGLKSRAIYGLAEKGNILNGYPDGTFLPKKTVTRAEAAKILTEAFEVTLNESRLIISSL